MSGVTVNRIEYAREVMERLERIASVDGLSVRQANNAAQSRAWAGAIGVFDGPHLVYAANRPDNVRGFLYSRHR